MRGKTPQGEFRRRPFLAPQGLLRIFEEAFFNMAVLLFSFGMRREEHRVRRILKKLNQDVEAYRSVVTLSRRFERPRGDICLMVFLIGRHDILNHLILLKNQMYDLPIALVLPDADRETILKGHKFYPRFITFADGDSSDLSLAIQNIVHRKCLDRYEATGEEAQMDSNLQMKKEEGEKEWRH